MHRERPLIIVIALWAFTTILWRAGGILLADFVVLAASYGYSVSRVARTSLGFAR